MGLYARCVFPILCDHLQPAHLVQERADLLSEISGRVLEIGFGTGLSLAHYSESITRLVGLDPERGMLLRARARRERVAFPVQVLGGVAEHLPFPDACFDAVVSTCTLCTVRDPAMTLEEIARVLRPGGRFHFLEHGMAGKASLLRLQRWLEPLHVRLGCGCHLTRDILDGLDRSPLRVLSSERFTLRGAPAYLGQMVSGVAET